MNNFLGVFISTSERQACIVAGLRGITQLVGPEIFHSKRCPSLVITDDCDAEGAAIKEMWPDTQRLLCTFHVGQATWRWLREAAHGIPASKRQECMRLFQSLMYCRKIDSFDRRYFK